MRYYDRHAKFDDRQADIRLILDCIAGERQVKRQGEVYLPRPTAMRSDDYEAYKTRATFEGHTAMTHRALVGSITRRQPKVEVPRWLQPMLISTTGNQEPFSIFFEQVVAELMSLGRAGILLDFPVDGNDSLTVPHFNVYGGDQILEMKSRYHGGREVLEKAVVTTSELHEGYELELHLEMEDGVYTCRKAYFDPVEKERVHVAETVPIVRGAPLDYIPFWSLTTEGMTYGDVKPPLLDLANLEIHLYMIDADYAHALHMLGGATPVISGNLTEENTPRSIGAGTVWRLPEGATATLLEFSGQGMGAFVTAMDRKRDAIVAQGARLLSSGVVRNETEETARNRLATETSLLVSTVNHLEAGLATMLRVAAYWVGGDPDEVAVECNRDFVESTMSGRMLEALTKSRMAGAISQQTYLENLSRGELLHVDVQTELDRLAEDGGDLMPNFGQPPRIVPDDDGSDDVA